MAMKINELLQLMIKSGISDIHFKAGSPPLLRVHGSLTVTDLGKLDARAINEMALSLLSDDQKTKFNKEHEIDLSYAVDGLSRFRVNIYRQRGTLALTLRVVPLKVKNFEELNLPIETMKKLAGEQRGLVLIAGITGSGKTTTLNSIINHINENYTYQIVTVEDPIEFFHADKKSSIVQREIGPDTESYKNALKYSLRQDPDVIVIGEMRDYDAISAAITAAETGHLVISTIHTSDAVHTIDRIVDAYPQHQQAQVRNQISRVLKGIIAQRLLPSADGTTRWPATEVLIGTSLIKKIIVEGKPEDIYKALEQGEYYKMHTFDQDLIRLAQEKKISMEEAVANATNPEDLTLKVRGIGVLG